jgi:hypothetical protein
MRKIALAALLAVSATAAHADTFNVTIGGSCTKFFLNVQQFTVAGTRYGCAGTAIEGGAVARVDRQRGVVVSETLDNIVVTWYFTTPEAGGGKVYVSGSNGEVTQVLGVSTYQIMRDGTPPASGSGGPDIMKSFDFSKLQHQQ